MNPPDPNKRLSAREAADYTGYSVGVMSVWRGRGLGPIYFKSDGAKAGVTYLVSDLDEWLADHRVLPAREAAILAGIRAGRELAATPLTDHQRELLSRVTAALPKRAAA